MKWPEAKLGTLLSLEYGSALRENDRDSKGGFPVAGSNGIVGYHSKALVKGPGIVVGRKGSAGEVTWFNDDFWPIDTTYYVRLLKPSDLRWTYYCLKCLNLSSLSIITGVPGLNRNDAYNLKVRVPAISEQRRIVEILDQADVLRKKRAEADAKAARILPALFYKMFGDPVTLMVSDNAVSLERMEIEIQNGFACGEKNVTDGVPHLRMNNIDDAGVLNVDLIRTVPEDRDEERYRLKSGDVLFMGTNSEDKVGKSCVFYLPDNRHYLFSNHLVRIRVHDHRISPEFLSFFLHLLWGKRFYLSIAKRWVNQASVAQDALLRIRIPIPLKTDLDNFAEFFKQILRIRDYRQKNFEKIETIFRYLLQRAFTGDLTSKWREAHMKELLAEMEAQAKVLGLE
jgi:type I restriction enzyme S subunit